MGPLPPSTPWLCDSRPFTQPCPLLLQQTPPLRAATGSTTALGAALAGLPPRSLQWAPQDCTDLLGMLASVHMSLPKAVSYTPPQPQPVATAWSQSLQALSGQPSPT